jgi:phage/plasmid-like protein (TIGR03299 family)
MSHEVDTMAYRLAGGLPWHGLGTPMPDGVSVEESFRLAKMTWLVEMHRAFVRNPAWQPGLPIAEKAIEVPNLRVALRNDTWTPLGYASASYVPIQLPDLAKVWDPVLRDADGTQRGMIETVISLRGGARIVLVIKVPGDWHVAGEAHVPYLTAMTSFDSSSNAIWGLTITRTVCANTLSMALGEWRGNEKGITLATDDEPTIGKSTRALRVRHRGNVAAKMEKVSGVFEKAFSEFNGYKARAEKLAATRISLSDARDILAQVIEGESERSTKMREDVLALSVGGVGQRGTDMAGTAYGLLQGTTEYVDHHRMLDATAERRYAYVTDGAGSRLKQRMQATLVREYASATQASEATNATLLDSILQ